MNDSLTAIHLFGGHMPEDDFSEFELRVIVPAAELHPLQKRIAVAERLGVRPDLVVVNEEGEPLTRADLQVIDLGDDDE